MATYLILNVAFLAIVALLFRIRPRIPKRHWIAMFCILMIMTAVFDSLLIAVGIVGYDLDKILGIYIGKAPIEDFFYAILAAIIIPLIWNRNGAPHDQRA